MLIEMHQRYMFSKWMERMKKWSYHTGTQRVPRFASFNQHKSLEVQFALHGRRVQIMVGRRWREGRNTKNRKVSPLLLLVSYFHPFLLALYTLPLLLQPPNASTSVLPAFSLTSFLAFLSFLCVCPSQFHLSFPRPSLYSHLLTSLFPSPLFFFFNPSICPLSLLFGGQVPVPRLSHRDLLTNRYITVIDSVGAQSV